MDKYIIPFKTELKKYQVHRKNFIQMCEEELSLLRRLINIDESVLRELNSDNLLEKFNILSTFYSIQEMQKDIISIFDRKKRKRKKEQKMIDFNKIYIDFFDSVKDLKEKHKNSQNIINAFDNDKLKNPINDINTLIEQTANISLPIETFNRILGITISFNNQYAQKNKNHQIQNIEIISQLTEYYNQDGSFKYNENIEQYQELLELLFGKTLQKMHNRLYVNNFHNLFRTFSIESLVNSLKENNQTLKNNASNSQTTEIPKAKEEDYSISPENRKILEELKKYYKNGTIIKIPENLEEFYQTLNSSILDESEKRYIISLMEQEIAKQKSMNILSYLTEDEQYIYEKASNLLNSFNHSNNDKYTLKQYIEELQTILSMLEDEADEENKNYLLNEIPNIMEKLFLICNKYEQTNEPQTSSNTFIFLLDKDGTPYIYNDINSINQNYQKAIYSLLPKINRQNQYQFKRILNNEPLPYNMQEITSLRGHVAFVEIISEIYIIIGANIPRNGYKELINRLKANQNVIKQIEDTIKNEKALNQLLIEHEEFLPLFSNNKNEHHTRKLTTKK